MTRSVAIVFKATLDDVWNLRSLQEYDVCQNFLLDDH